MSRAPEPQPVDLSSVVRHLRRSSTRKNASLREDALTREFLEAGARLINRQYQPRTGAPEADGSDDPRPFLSTVSQRAVSTEVSRSTGLRVSDGALRYRWETITDYHADLIAYMLWAGHWAPHISTAGAAEIPLTRGDAVAAIEELAYLDLLTVLDIPSYRFQLVATAYADRDPLVRDALVKMYESHSEAWQQLYTKFVDTHGLTLRPGVSLADLTTMLSAAAEGLGMRLAADPSASIVDHERRSSLLGTIAVALALAVFDTGDGLSPHDLLRTRLPGVNADVAGEPSGR